MSILHTATSKWNDYLFSPVAGTDLALSRILFSVLSILILLPSSGIVGLATSGGDVYSPVGFFQWFDLEPISPAVAALMERVLFGACLMSAFGIISRPSTLIAFGLLFAINVFRNSHSFYSRSHNLAAVIWGILAVSSYSRRFSLDSFIFKSKNWLTATMAEEKSAQFSWPHKLIQCYIAFVYFAAGTQKLRVSGTDWFLTENLAAIMRLPETDATELGIYVASLPFLSHLLQFLVILIEVMAPLALLGGRWQICIWNCFLFHVGARLLIYDKLYSEHLICFVFFVPWTRLWNLIGGPILLGARRAALRQSP